MTQLGRMAGAGTSLATAGSAGLLGENELAEIESAWPNGLTSRQIVDVFAERGVRFSEATLRKYVQLGLLPRSVRVGRKGKHSGSCGLYPAGVVRRVNRVKELMASDHTIEDIQRSFKRFQEEIDQVANRLRELIAGFEREAQEPAIEGKRRRELEREIGEAKQAAGELVRRISGLEASLSTQAAAAAAGSAARGGSDLY